MKNYTHHLPNKGETVWSRRERREFLSFFAQILDFSIIYCVPFKKVKIRKWSHHQDPNGYFIACHTVRLTVSATVRQYIFLASRSSSCDRIFYSLIRIQLNAKYTLWYRPCSRTHIITTHTLNDSTAKYCLGNFALLLQNSRCRTSNLTPQHTLEQ